MTKDTFFKAESFSTRLQRMLQRQNMMLYRNECRVKHVTDDNYVLYIFYRDMSTEMKDQFIIIPKHPRAWGKVPTWKEPSNVVKDSEPSFVDIMNEQLQEKVEVMH